MCWVGPVGASQLGASPAYNGQVASVVTASDSGWGTKQVVTAVEPVSLQERQCFGSVPLCFIPN